MIIFNNAGHCFVSAPVSQDPIVWVDAQDISTYTLGTASGLGNELVVNGDFANNSDWDLVNCNISNGKLNFPVSSGTRYARQNNVTEEGKTYKLSFECTDYTAGTARFLGGAGASSIDSPVVSSIGSYDFTFTTTPSTYGRIWFFDTNDFIGSIDNISVKEVLAYDVTNLDNKGELGGVMTLNGSVKFANGGFESWSGSDFVRFFIGEPFMTDNSFTIATTFNFQNIAQQNNRGWWSSLYADNNNRIIHNRDNDNVQSTSISSSNVNINAVNYQLGVQTLISSYDITTNTIQLMNFNGSNLILNSISFNNIDNSVIWLLRAGSSPTTSTGANNPLHEFRLYNRAMSLVEMQDLQTELNNKYLILGDELIVNGDFSDGLNGWSYNSNASATVVNGLVRVEVISSASGYLFQNVTGLQAGKTYSITANGYVGTSTKISLYTAKNGFNDLTNDGVINVNFTATDADEVVRLYTYGNGTYGEWDNISVKEILN